MKSPAHSPNTCHETILKKAGWIIKAQILLSGQAKYLVMSSQNI
jgi:hypothetical protein